MPIPYDALQKWAKPGKNEMSKQTYAALRELLLERLDGQPNIYLQGSYRNSTNVKDNSDIDIVVEYDSNIDVTRLKDYIYGRIDNARNFHFTTGAKTVKYKGLRNQYVPADIVPCVSVRGKTGCVALYDSSKKTIIHNYPMIHIQNGEDKSGRTDGNSKKVVRIMKNARNYLEDDGIKVKVSSFVIECMLYNVPDETFSGNESDILYNVLDWFAKNRNSIQYMHTQDGKFSLFPGPGVSVSDATQFIDEVINLWNNWGK